MSSSSSTTFPPSASIILSIGGASIRRDNAAAMERFTAARWARKACLSICHILTYQLALLTALDKLKKLRIWSAPVLKTSTSAAEHLPVPRLMPHRWQRQRGNMADDSDPHKDSAAPLRPSQMRMRPISESRDLGIQSFRILAKILKTIFGRV